MQVKSQKKTSVAPSSYYGLRARSLDRFLLGINKIYIMLRRGSLKTADNFLHASLSADQKNDFENAVAVLEVGLSWHPEAEHLLENYLRICCEHEQFVRAIAFISKKKHLRHALLRLRIIQSPTDKQADGQKHALDWFAEHALGKGCDAATLWQLADLLEQARQRNIAIKIYHKLSLETLNDSESYYFAGLSEVRLGNVDYGFEIIRRGMVAYPQAESLKALLKQLCYLRGDFDYGMKLSESCSGSGAIKEPLSVVAFFREVIKSIPPEAFVIKFSEVQHKCSPDELQLVIDDFLSGLRNKMSKFESAKQIIFLSKLLDVDAEFSEMLRSTLSSLDWKDDAAEAEYTFSLIHKFTLPIAYHRSSDLEQVVRKFVSNTESINSEITHLREPLSDFSRDWAPWQGLFCLAQPRLYRHGMSAFERLAFGLWPKLNYTAPHIGIPPEHSSKKIRIGFTVLDLMPMMSGLMERLDKNIFETVFLRPGAAGESKVASDWVSRADRTVEYSDTDTYSAINTIAQQELDILISGPSVPQIFFPLMARVAHLQMVLLEPNWTDGITNSDYYISWKSAEPEKFRDFYNTPVSLLRHPPYWIESPPSGRKLAISENTDDKIRERLLNLAPQDSFYICANTPPKIHPEMDELIYRILDKDPTSFMVLLRSEHGAAQPVKARLREKLGKHYERIIFLNTLKREDAHALLSAADCCLDSYPLCGMSSSFDGLMLGVPIVTLPVDIPFGRWTAAIYEYIGVSGLTARDMDEYVDIATRMVSDKNWRLAKSNELREKSARYVESEAGFDEFQHFILQAWRRKQAGLPPASWVDGEWQLEQSIQPLCQ